MQSPKTLEEVFAARITRYREGFSTSNLGAVGADLEALASFFDRPWSQVSPKLSPEFQAHVFGEAAHRLILLCRLKEAIEPLELAFEMSLEQKDWKNVSVSANNLGYLKLVLGEISEARIVVKKGMKYAKASGLRLERLKNLITMANILHQEGDFYRSQVLFYYAERILLVSRPEVSFLYADDGFHYCDLLLTETERAAWKRFLNYKDEKLDEHKSYNETLDHAALRAQNMLQIAKQKNLPLDIGLAKLTLGRLALYRWLCLNDKNEESIRSLLDDGVNNIRDSGDLPYLPSGFLTRAWYRCLINDSTGARIDLDDARELAERGPMPLQQADILLTQSRLFFRDDLAQSEQSVEEAKKLINRHAYNRRTKEYQDAKEAIKNWME